MTYIAGGFTFYHAASKLLVVVYTLLHFTEFIGSYNYLSELKSAAEQRVKIELALPGKLRWYGASLYTLTDVDSIPTGFHYIESKANVAA